MIKSGIIIILLGFLVLILSSCEEGKVVPPKAKDTIDIHDLPDQIGWDNKVFFIDSSFTKAILNAKRARIYNKRNETLLDGCLYVEFLSRINNKRTSYLTADSAKIDDITKNMLAGGHVVVVSDSTRTRVETSLLYWNNKTQMFYSSEFVRVTKPNETVQGYGFESDQSLSNYKIFKVSGEQK